jgi:hypothetical protein
LAAENKDQLIDKLIIITNQIIEIAIFLQDLVHLLRSIQKN